MLSFLQAYRIRFCLLGKLLIRRLPKFFAWRPLLSMRRFYSPFLRSTKLSKYWGFHRHTHVNYSYLRDDYRKYVLSSEFSYLLFFRGFIWETFYSPHRHSEFLLGKKHLDFYQKQQLLVSMPVSISKPIFIKATFILLLLLTLLKLWGRSTIDLFDYWLADSLAFDKLAGVLPGLLADYWF